MLKKLKELIYSWCNKINQFSDDGCYIRAAFTFILPPIVIALLIVLFIKAITAGFNFLYGHATQLVMAALVLWAFVAWLDKHRASRIELDRKEQEVRERQDYSERLEAAQTKEATYTAQAKILFSVVRDLGPLGIVPPATLSGIYSPGHTVSKAKGTVALSLYLLQKDCETVDVDLLRHTLQTKIDQRLQAGEFPDIPERHVYRGRVYSGFVVDMVRDSMGGFVEVYTALVDDSYCRYRENRELNRYRLLPPVDRRDTDY